MPGQEFTVTILGRLSNARGYTQLKQLRKTIAATMKKSMKTGNHYKEQKRNFGAENFNEVKKI